MIGHAYFVFVLCFLKSVPFSLISSLYTRLNKHHAKKKKSHSKNTSINNVGCPKIQSDGCIACKHIFCILTYEEYMYNTHRFTTKYTNKWADCQVNVHCRHHQHHCFQSFLCKIVLHYIFVGNCGKGKCKTICLLFGWRWRIPDGTKWMHMFI